MIDKDAALVAQYLLEGPPTRGYVGNKSSVVNDIITVTWSMTKAPEYDPFRTEGNVIQLLCTEYYTYLHERYAVIEKVTKGHTEKDRADRIWYKVVLRLIWRKFNDKGYQSNP